MNIRLVLSAVAMLTTSGPNGLGVQNRVRLWQPYDFAFTEHSEVANPFQVLFSAEVTGPNRTRLVLPGFYDDWITVERERLQTAFESKCEALIDRLSREMHWPDVIEWAEHWIKFGTAPEPAYRALMLAHSAAGDRASMAAAYQRCAEALRHELDVEVLSDRTAEKAEHIFHHARRTCRVNA